MSDDLKCVRPRRKAKTVFRLSRRDQQQTVLDTVREIKLLQTKPQARSQGDAVEVDVHLTVDVMVLSASARPIGST